MYLKWVINNPCFFGLFVCLFILFFQKKSLADLRCIFHCGFLFKCDITLKDALWSPVVIV